MSEMLGNRYFIARQFDKAIAPLERALASGRPGDKIKKKLILCYIQVGQADQALDYFFDLIQKDPSIITETDLYYDDCPCRELVPYWTKLFHLEPDSAKLAMILGMLYLYCDVETSKEYFNQAQNAAQYSVKVAAILKKINALPKLSH